MLSVKQGGIKYHFWVFSMTRPEIEPRSPGPLANTLLIWPMVRYIYIRQFVHDEESIDGLGATDKIFLKYDITQKYASPK